MEYGLWQTKQQVEEGLAKLKSKTSKLQAVKTQLDFWRSFGTKSCRQKQEKIKLSVDDVAISVNFLLPATNMSSDPEGLIGRRIRHRWNVEGS